MRLLLKLTEFAKINNLKNNTAFYTTIVIDVCGPFCARLGPVETIKVYSLDQYLTQTEMFLTGHQPSTRVKLIRDSHSNLIFTQMSI